MDQDFTLWESRPILIYLFDKYGKDETLYPKDPKVRATINQRLYFDIGTLYSKVVTYYVTKFEEKKEVSQELITSMETTLGFLDTFLGKTKFVAANHLTLADFTVFISVICYEMCKIDISKFANIVRWFKVCKETLPGYPELHKTYIPELEKFF